MDDQGWVKVWRKVGDNPRMRDARFLGLWVVMLMLATHKEREATFKGQRITLKPGQFITGRKYLTEHTGIPGTTIERFLSWMQSGHQIGQQKSTKNRLITVINWDRYQKDGQQTDNKRTHTRMEERKERNNTLASQGATPVISAGREPTDIQRVVDRYFDLQGADPATRKVSYPRHVRDAQALLKASDGDVTKAQAVLEALHQWAMQRKLSYTIGTALKRWQQLGRASSTTDWDANMKRIQDEVDKYKREHHL